MFLASSLQTWPFKHMSSRQKLNDKQNWTIENRLESSASLLSGFEESSDKLKKKCYNGNAVLSHQKIFYAMKTWICSKTLSEGNSQGKKEPIKNSKIKNKVITNPMEHCRVETNFCNGTKLLFNVFFIEFHSPMQSKTILAWVLL